MQPRIAIAAALASLALALLMPGPSQAAYDSAPWERLLARHVKDGRVDYQALRKDKDLDAYVSVLRNTTHAEYSNWSTVSKKAFWINAYNALVLKQVADNYPCESRTLVRAVLFPRYSPQNVKGFFAKKRFRILDELCSLDHIQRVVLRIRFHDVKTLFALCPGAKGGPALRGEAYDGPHLQEQLEERIKRMIADPAQFRIDRAAHAVHASAFFEWFGADFIPLMDRSFDEPTKKEKERAIAEFIMDYVSREDAEFLKDPTIKIEFNKYDWSLNDAPGK